MSSLQTESLQEQRAKLLKARESVASVVLGQAEVVDQIFIALISGGHVLVEGAPGLGKTLLVQTVAKVCGLEFSRIQFTPDLMPSDITGALVLVHDSQGIARTEFRAGPIFAQLVLTDELNRATPKTQSALLEAMQERTVTVAGVERQLPTPFFVLATQNPIEMEGTYQLPEAQTDRFFFRVDIPFPDPRVLGAILDRTTGAMQDEPVGCLDSAQIIELQGIVREIRLPEVVRDGVVRFVQASQPQLPSSTPEVKRFVRFGVSPRGGQALVLAAKAHAFMAGRYNVALEDVHAVALPALRHRFRLNYEATAEGRTVEGMLRDLLRQFVK